jgi:hypothetical protein
MESFQYQPHWQLFRILLSYSTPECHSERSEESASAKAIECFRCQPRLRMFRLLNITLPGWPHRQFHVVCYSERSEESARARIME